MMKSSKTKTKIVRPKHRELTGRLDMDALSTATAFRAAAKAFTAEATRTKETAMATLRREGILTKSGAFTKAYAKKG